MEKRASISPLGELKTPLVSKGDKMNIKYMGKIFDKEENKEVVIILLNNTIRKMSIIDYINIENEIEKKQKPVTNWNTLQAVKELEKNIEEKEQK